MSLTTTTTPADIATALGRPSPDAGSVTESQWQMHIDDALMLIDDRATRLAITEVDAAKLDYVIREAVVAHVLRPDSATQVTISVDDASTSKTYRSSTGRVSILDEWWALMGLAGAGRGRAFEVDTMPATAGIYGTDYVWLSTTETGPVP